MSSFHFSPRPNRAHEINWREWGDTSFAEAQSQDKLILLGISAVWCHWCHVMDETSYSDPEIIRLINERYVAIRVDNDQRPDVNRRYNLGGWPTTAFLTPTGDLLTGGTYIPPTQMRSYLTQVGDAYKNTKETLLAKIAAMDAQREQSRGARAATAKPAPAIVDAILRDIQDNFDSVYGGFGDAPKFPQTDALELVVEKYYAMRDEQLLTVITITLTQMARGGTYDQEAGGFFRYSTTRDWSVPHFEKMLEDNAKLLSVLTRAYQVTQREIFLKTIQPLVAYANSTLGDQTRGGFYGSQDADEHYYALSLAERATLTAPYVDHTFYTDWNAMMATGYLQAATVLRDDSIRERALKTLDRIWNEMYRADAGLFHFQREGSAPQLLNQLSDLAYTARAFLDAYQTTGENVYLQRAQTLAEIALAKLHDADAGAFWSEPREHASLGLLRLPDKSLVENSAMADVLIRLCRLTDDHMYLGVAEKTLEFFAGEYSRYGIMAAAYAMAVDHLLNEPVTVHIVGAIDNADTRELHAAAFCEYAPAKIVQLLDPARDAARISQLGYPINTTPLAYVCVGQKCLAPISDAKGVIEGIKQISK